MRDASAMALVLALLVRQRAAHARRAARGAGRSVVGLRRAPRVVLPAAVPAAQVLPRALEASGRSACRCSSAVLLVALPRRAATGGGGAGGDAIARARAGSGCRRGATIARNEAFQRGRERARGRARRALALARRGCRRPAAWRSTTTIRARARASSSSERCAGCHVLDGAGEAKGPLSTAGRRAPG